MKHLVKARERQRKKRGLKRRYFGTLSYKLEANPKAFAKFAKEMKAVTAKVVRSGAKSIGAAAKKKKRT